MSPSRSATVTEIGAKPAANEVAVEAFLERRLGFMQISSVVEQTLQQIPVSKVTDLDALLATDAEARHVARELIERDA